MSGGKCNEGERRERQRRDGEMMMRKKAEREKWRPGLRWIAETLIGEVTARGGGGRRGREGRGQGRRGGGRKRRKRRTNRTTRVRKI